jgi:methyl-accepting chemotaxis protein
MVRKNTERALAQGSALAAREIKDLISNSLQTVDEGTTLVNHAGETMDKIVASISNVTQIMSGMASASSEQSAGVA